MISSTGLTSAISKRLFKHRLFYVCRDIERGLGGPFSLKNYYIITNYNKFSAQLARQYPHIILLKERCQLDTIRLLTHEQTKKIIKQNDLVLVFKNNSLIEDACRKNGWRLLNPDSRLADKIENKISQIEWLGNLAKYLPPHSVDVCNNIKWRGEPFIAQFNHSHTGRGTLLIDSKKKLSDVKLKFPKREARAVKYIKGPVFTNNNIVWGGKILIGNISYQITGLLPFTENKFATIGNDWALPGKLLNYRQIKQYKKIATEIGKKLKKDGWKGLYGADIIVDEKTERLYLLEINARQPASATFESQLQQKSEIRNPKSEISTFEAHVASLINIPNDKYRLIPIHDGAQIVQRVTKKINKIRLPKIKDKSIINIITYNNNSLGADLVRAQSCAGIMQNENMPNKLGKQIRAAILAAKN
jgi:hypothetical protein